MSRCGATGREPRERPCRRPAGLRRIRAVRPAHRGGRTCGSADLLRRAAGRLFRAAGRDAAISAGPGLFDLFAGGIAAVAARQTAHDRSERLDDERRGGRLPRPELPHAISNHASGQAHLYPFTGDRDAARARDAAVIPRFSLSGDYTISRIVKGGWHLAGDHGSIDPDQARRDMATFVDAGITT